MNSDSPHPRAALASDPVSPQERLSAWLDGELDPEASARVLDELLRDRQHDRAFSDWCLVGDALRSAEVAAADAPRLRARLHAALEAEPALLAPAALPPVPRRWVRRVSSGVAAVAAMAVVAVVGNSMLGVDPASEAGAPTQVVSAEPVRPPVRPAAEVKINPSAVERAAAFEPYIAAHRNFAGSPVMPAAMVVVSTGDDSER